MGFPAKVSREADGTAITSLAILPCQSTAMPCAIFARRALQ
jgi:hypothetical protein